MCSVADEQLYSSRALNNYRGETEELAVNNTFHSEILSPAHGYIPVHLYTAQYTRRSTALIDELYALIEW